MKESYIYESNPSNNCIVKRFLDIRSAFPPGLLDKKEPIQTTDKPLILLTTHNNPNYFHWMTTPGTSPLFLAEHFSVPIPPETRIAISTRPKSPSIVYPTDIINLLRPNLRLNCGFFSASTSKTTFALHQLKTAVFTSPRHIKWLRQKLSCYLKPIRTTNKRLLISRSTARSRRCLNEKCLYDSLSRYGFELVTLDLLSVVDQLQLFSEAEIIIAAHGAALTNLIVCKARTSVIEILPCPGPFHHYYMMSEILDLRHGHLLADKSLRETGDFYVNPDSIVKLMGTMSLI